MHKNLRRYRFTLASVVIGAILVSTGMDHFDLAYSLVRFLQISIAFTADEFVLPVILVAMGVFVDLLSSKQQLKKASAIEAGRLRVLQATMRTVQDIVGNFLNGTQLLRMEAEIAMVPQESLQLFDDLIQDATQKIRLLADLDHVCEMAMASGPGIDYSTIPHKGQTPVKTKARAA